MTQARIFYGTKRIEAWEATSPHDVEVGQARETGYAVRYADGYTSWSPAAVFEAAYQPITAMNFGHALAAVKDGYRVARAGWTPDFRLNLASITDGWLPSATEGDMMADDWMVVGEAKPE